MIKPPPTLRDPPTFGVLELALRSGIDRPTALRAIHTDLANLEGVNTYDRSLSAGRSVSLSGLGVFTFCLPDVVIDRDGRVRLTEVNTSNAALTFPHDADTPRVTHMVDTLIGRGICASDGDVILVPRSPDTSLAPEIKIRALQMALQLRERGAIETHVRDVSIDVLPTRGVTVVTGPIPDVVAALRLEQGMLAFRGRRVIFFSNQNLVAALARRDGIDVKAAFDSISSDTIHEGAAMAQIGIDKALQQELARGTGITPVASRRGAGLKETVELACEMAHTYGGAVVKPDASSGGTSVVMVDPQHSRRAITEMITAGRTKMLAKYGPRWERTCPLRVYEFVHVKPAVRDDGARFRWDLRFEVLARPGTTVITPTVARTCPRPIGSQITPATAMTNLTGRARGENERLSPRELLRRSGQDLEIVDEIAEGLLQWVRNALGATFVH
jgi:hypothetical protein